MGLAERRAVQEFETNNYPALKKLIDEAAGFPVTVEVKWDTLMKEERYVKGWKTGWPKIYFEPVVEAFKQICSDDMGRDALKAKLAKVVVQHTKTSHSSNWAEWSNGTLTLDHGFTNIDQVKDRTTVLVKCLEKVL